VQKYISAFMPFLIQGLNSFDAQTLCTVSVGVLVDVCTAVGPAVQPYCDEIMASLRNVLQDSSVTRDIKPVVISAFGDVAVAIEAAYEPYLQISVMMLMQAAQQSAPADDEDLVVFINSLRLAILEAYSGIVIGLSGGNALHLVLPHVSEILGFVRFLSSPESNRDEDVLHKAVTLLGDIAQHMGAHGVVRQQMTQPFVAQLINDAMEDPTLRDTASWAQGIIVSVVQQTA
jgi:importin subunit beta-1